MKGKAGRPHIPLSTISNRKSDGLTASPDITADTAPTGATAGAMARGGAPKKRADKKRRGIKRADGGSVPKKQDNSGDDGEDDMQPSEGKASGGWIKGAIKHPGAEKKAAKKAGMSTHAYMEKHKHDSGKSGSRARLGLTLSGMAKGKK